MKSNLRGRNYKIIKEFRIEVRKIFSNFDKSDYNTDSKFFMLILAQPVLVNLLRQMDSELHNEVINRCYKELNITAKYKLSKVLGRKLHLFHVVFPSI